MIRTVAEFIASFSSFARPHPARDWFATLMVSFVLFGAVAAYVGYLFWGLRGGGIIGAVDNSLTAPPAVSRAELTSVLETYRARSVNFDAGNFLREDLFDPR